MSKVAVCGVWAAPVAELNAHLRAVEDAEFPARLNRVRLQQLLLLLQLMLRRLLEASLLKILWREGLLLLLMLLLLLLLKRIGLILK